MIFERLANVILKRSKLIVILWIIILICAVPIALKAGSVLDYDTTNMAGPDAESIKGAMIVDEYFYSPDTQVEATVLLVASFDTPEEKMHALSLNEIMPNEFLEFLDKNGLHKVTDFQIYGLYTASDDANKGVVIYAVIYGEQMVNDNLVAGDTPELRKFIGKVLSDHDMTGVTTYVSGTPAIAYDTEASASEDISKIDIFSVLMILILVGLFFRSFVTSAMPPMTIGVAFGVVLCLMFFIGSVLDIIYMTEMILLVSMLGAGCDYCIFILARYREERVHGAEHEAAVKSAVTWAGESITTSGLAVVIGFGAMSICSFSMISSMGVMLAVGIIIALVAALTLITSVLAILGEKLFWPTKMESLKEGGKAEKGWHGKMSRFGHRYFTKSVNASIKHAKLIIAVAVLFTVPAAYIMMTSESSYDMIGSMSTGEGKQGLNEIGEYTNGGMIMPSYVVLEMAESLGQIYNADGAPIGLLFWNPDNDPKINDYLKELSTLSSTLSEDDNIGEVWGVYAWHVPALNEKIVPFVPKGGMSDHEYTIAVYSAAANELPNTLKMQLLAPSQKTGTSLLEDIIKIYETAAASGVKYNNMDLKAAFGEVRYDNVYLNAMVNWVLNYVLATSVGGESGYHYPTALTHVKYTFITKDSAMSDRSMDTIQSVDGMVSEFIENNQDMVSDKWLTGSAVVMYEISELVSSEFLKVEILAVVLIFILLFFVMKSFVTPIRSILTILMSVVWTVAVTHLIFGNLMGEGVIWMIPIILIVVCLGLGMDYDILLTTRIKENHLHRGMSNDDAIRHAVTHSGSVITICGLIMGGAFGTLMLSGTNMLQEFGFALCFAILIDALLVRTYIVPAAMHLLGDLNWKGPKFMQKKTTKPPE
ncbi:MAG: MMPL family transporter [Candidatus Methanoplasma sp.]|jgi:RND superfamily putative drug exporter|nr:MMPL family transporter [Candidatus Methanoplasma sp.]